MLFNWLDFTNLGVCMVDPRSNLRHTHPLSVEEHLSTLCPPLLLLLILDGLSQAGHGQVLPFLSLLNFLLQKKKTTTHTADVRVKGQL